MKFKAFLLAYIKSAKILDETGVQELENLEEGADIPTELAEKINTGFTAHITKVQADAEKKGRTEGHGKGKRESMTDFEATLKSEFGVESTALGIDLVKEVIEAKVSNVSKLDPAKMTEAELLKLQPVAKLNDELAKAKKAIDDLTATNQSLTDFKTQAETRETNNFISSVALSEFKKLNPALPDDAVKAENQTKLFQQLILAGKYKVEEENGQKVIYPVSDTGDYLTDPVSKARLNITDHVKGLTEQYFGIVQQSAKGSPGNNNNNQGGAGGGEWKAPAMKTREDLDKALAEAKDDPTKNAAIMKAWKETNN